MDTFFTIIAQYVSQADIAAMFGIWLLTQMFKVWDKKNRFEGFYIAFPPILGILFGILIASMTAGFVWQAAVLKGFLMGVFTAYAVKFMKDWMGFKFLGDTDKNRK